MLYDLDRLLYCRVGKSRVGMFQIHLCISFHLVIRIRSLIYTICLGINSGKIPSITPGVLLVSAFVWSVSIVTSGKLTGLVCLGRCQKEVVQNETPILWPTKYHT